MPTMREIIAKMREGAHLIAIERRKKWWDSLTDSQRRHMERQWCEESSTEKETLEEFKPGVIELNEKDPTTPYTLQMQLLMQDIFVPLQDLAEQTQPERDKASLWCATVMLSASDNDVIIAPRPEWLPARDSSGWEHGDVGDLVRADYELHGGEEEAKRKFDAAFKPTIEVRSAVVIDQNYESEPFWARQLRGIADTLLEIAGGDRRMDKKDLIDYGEWIHAWLDHGAPMLESAEDAEHDPTDTGVDRDLSERSPDGNGSDTKFSRDRSTITGE